MKLVVQPRSERDVRRLIQLTALQIIILRDRTWSHLCGQACVATVAGVTLDDAIIATRQTGETNCVDLSIGLRFFGFRLRVVASPKRWQSYPKAILNVHLEHQPKGFKQHWVVSEHGRIYNPDGVTCERLDEIEGIELNGQNPVDLCLVLR
jgi:hypothetical protein